MIDPRKALEGTPGLVVMAACAFAGATIGIALAFWLTWIKPSDAVANFLGGVVGAGLGAALAVLGSVYIQSRSRTEALLPNIVALTRQLSPVLSGFGNVLQYIVVWNEQTREGWLRKESRDPAELKKCEETVWRLVSAAKAELDKLPSGHDWSREWHTLLRTTKHQLAMSCNALEDDVRSARFKNEHIIKCDKLTDAFAQLRRVQQKARYP